MPRKKVQMKRDSKIPNSILVFDSGLGGLSIVQELTKSSINADIYYCADTAYFPYGEKSDASLIARIPIFIKNAASACDANLVIVACNTASTLALDLVRAMINIPVIGVVPAIKPATALTKSGVIGLLGTPNTIGRPYTDRLVSDFGSGKKVLRYGAIGLAAVGEAKLAGEAVDMAVVKASIEGLFGQIDGDKIDVVVLACTHYPHLKPELAALAPFPVAWIDSGAAIARRARDVLKLEDGGQTVLRDAFTTGGAEALTTIGLKRWGFQQVTPLPPIAWGG
jgi:glutamate racemase